MIPLVITGLVLLGLPLILLIVFRSNAATMFLSACAGIVLLNSLDPSVVATAGAIVPGEGEAYVRLSVVILPIFFAVLLTRGAVHKITGLPLHLVVVVLISIMLWVMLPDLTRISWLQDSTNERVWDIVKPFNTLVVAIGFAISLVLSLKQKRGRGGKHHKGE